MPVDQSSRYIVRRLHPDDYDRGYLQTLQELTTVGALTKADFTRTFIPYIYIYLSDTMCRPTE
jgi:hypothetical protein